MESNNSHQIWTESLKVFPGGVNSPVRAYKSVNREPIVIREGRGAYITDEDGNSYLDFVNSWGPMILGHSDPDITTSIIKQSMLGTSFGAVTRYEYLLGKLIIDNIPFVEKIRFVNSGTEAVMSALRLARAYTGKNKVIKFEGCYHGHYDGMLVKAGSGLLTFSENVSESSSPGVSSSISADTIVLPLNDESKVEAAFKNLGNEIAAIIIEPLPANSGLLKQRNEFIQFLREITEKNSALLILDEVISGFRLGFSGFSGKYKISPDLVTYGKIIGGGLPVGAFGGSAKIMNNLSPEGKVYQAGTLSGNPLAMTAGFTALKKLLDNDIYEKLNNLSTYLENQFKQTITPLFKNKSFSIDLVVENSIFWFNIHEKKESTVVREVDKIWSGASALYGELFRYMLENGVHMAPSAYEVGFLSYPMEVKDIDLFITILKEAIESLS